MRREILNFLSRAPKDNYSPWKSKAAIDILIWNALILLLSLSLMWPQAREYIAYNWRSYRVLIIAIYL